MLENKLNATASVKHDFKQQNGMPEDIIPMWVADMDFPPPIEATQAVINVANRGLFGYSMPTERYYSAVCNWMQTRHNFKVDKSWVVRTTGVLAALSTAIHAYTKEGDSILIQPPVYFPFEDRIRLNNRKCVHNPLKKENDRYVIDYDDFEQKISSQNVKMFVLCNPHNPVGRAWSAEELIKMAEICLKNKVIIFSDEIHCDLVHGDIKHNMLVSLDERFSDIVITATSVGKTFTVAGMFAANSIIVNSELRELFTEKVDAIDNGNISSFSSEVCCALYENCEPWLEETLSKIRENVLFTAQFVNEQIPGISAYIPESTYLMWLDCRGLGLNTEELDTFLCEEAKIWCNNGAIFGQEGVGYIRMNIAMPKDRLKTALTRLRNAVLSRG